VLSPERAVALVCERGRLMASAPGTGRMALIAGLQREAVQRCCDDPATLGRAVIAAQNGPADHVVSGDERAVALACAAALRAGARHAGWLKTSHAFHSPLMQPVAPSWQALVRGLAMDPAVTPVIPNVTAEATSDPHGLRWGLLHQLTRPVEWWSTMRTLARLGVRTAVTCEPGNYLGGLARNAGLSTVSFADPRKVRALGGSRVAVT